MSTSSLYSPEEDDEDTSDKEDTESEPVQSFFPVSSPRIQDLALSSADESKSPARSQSRVPKRIRLRSRPNAWRALRKLPIGSYRELYAETCEDILQGSSDYAGRSLPLSQNGVTTWTSLEKDRFFNALTRVGKSRCRDIASAVGSKSEMEVRAYIQLLHRSLEHQHLVEPHTGSITLLDIPAASEISGKCCEALEQASEVISMEEQRSERTAAKRRHGNMSLIDRDVAEVVEEKFQNQTSEDQDKSDVDIMVGFLNLRNWIRTSERIFMNFGEPRYEDNWENLKFEGESPSITSEALLNFYALAVSVTRRLVQSSLFFAMSRVRSLESGSNHPSKAVRSRDVIAALDVLRMKHNSNAFWAGVARRCSLNVIDAQHENGRKMLPLNYDEVEEKLLGYPLGSSSSRVDASPLSSSESDGQSEQSDVRDDGSSPETPDSSASSTATFSDEELSDFEEAHASSLDKKASSSEEQHLWGILQSSTWQPNSPGSGPNERMKSNFTVPSKRKTKQDLVEWRDRLLFRSEWEEFGQDALTIEEELMENRRKRQKIGSQVHSEDEDGGTETSGASEQGNASGEEDGGTDESDDANDVDGYSDMDVDIPDVMSQD